MNKRQFFENPAEEWDRKHACPQEEERLEKIIQHFPLKRGIAVLDIGCGTGRLIPYLRQQLGPNGWLVEADFSAKMLRIGRSKYSASMVFFLQTDAQAVGLRSGLFDLIICFALFPHLDNKLQALFEFRRLLRPGGNLIIAHPLGRRELDRLHSQKSEVIKKDFLPAGPEMKKLLFQSGFREIIIVDAREMYLVKAVASSSETQEGLWLLGGEERRLS